MIELIGKYEDFDGTRKYIGKTKDGILEISHIRNREDRDVLCIPSLY